MRKNILSILLFLLCTPISLSQNSRVDSLTKLVKKADSDSVAVDLYLKISREYRTDRNKDSALFYLKKAIEKAQKISVSNNNYNAETGIFLTAKSFYEKAEFLYSLSELNNTATALDSALIYTEKILRNPGNEDLKNKTLILTSDIYTEISNVYIDKGYYSAALENTLKARKITDYLIKKGVLEEKENAVIYFYLGLINYYLKNLEESRSYYKKSMAISKKYNYTRGIINCNTNLGIVETELNNIDTALTYYKNNLEYLKDKEAPLVKAQTYDNMANCYIRQKKYKKAELYLAKAMIITEKYNITQGKVYVMSGLADLYKRTGKTNKALQFAKEALDIAQKAGIPTLKKDVYLTMSEVYEKKKDFKKSLHFYKKYKAIEDSLFDIEKSKQIKETEAKYHSEKKQEEINRQKLELAEREAEIKIKKIQNRIFSAVLILLLFVIFFIFRNLKQKQKINSIIKKQTKKITDSIEYAEKIQKAAIPSDKILKQLFKDHFVLYKPLQIVSGDFYWAVKNYDFTVFAAADCTGHGVPGAFVSMLGISLLNELTLINDLKRPDKILEEMRYILKKSFRQTGKKEEQTDGIDIALCSIDNKTDKLYFSGANNPAYIVRNGKLIILEAVPNPVGVYHKEIKFKLTEFDLKKGDVIYLFSDGYSDQFGGEKTKKEKYTLKRFTDMLIKIHKKEMSEQKTILEKEFQNWKKDTEQTDDILIFGIKY